MDKSTRKTTFLLVTIFLLLMTVCLGRIEASEEKALYINTEYLKEDENKTNCELKGAWTTNYENYWLPDPANLQQVFPNYVKNISYTGITSEASSIGLSTPESLNKNNPRNKFYLTSSLADEALEVTLDLQHENQFSEWFPLGLYFDPFVINNSKQQLSIKLSYANTNLGKTVYVQDINFESGCYLNLKVKLPAYNSLAKLVIELKPEKGSKPALSGIFWGKEYKENSLQVSYKGLNQISAPNWYETQKKLAKTILWSPSQMTGAGSQIVKVSLGDTTYSTSTGYEFPLANRQNTYNFQVLKGKSGKEGFNGLEFYINPQIMLCQSGCELGFYTTSNFKQNISLYSANIGTNNKLLSQVETNGEGLPVFHSFTVEPNESLALRVRITAQDPNSEPSLRGLYIVPTLTAPNPEDLLSLDSNTTVALPPVTSNSNLPSIAEAMSIMTIEEIAAKAEPIQNTTPLPQKTEDSQQKSTEKIANEIQQALNNAKEQQQKAQQLAEDAKIKAQQQAEEARLKAQQQAEEERKKAQQTAEDARLKAQQQAEEERKKAQQLAEDARLKAQAKQAEDLQKAKQLVEEEIKKTQQQTEEARLKAQQLAEEEIKKTQQQAEEARLKAQQQAEEERKKAQQLAEEEIKKAQQQAEEERLKSQQTILDENKRAKEMIEAFIKMMQDKVNSQLGKEIVTETPILLPTE